MYIEREEFGGSCESVAKAKNTRVRMPALLASGFAGWRPGGAPGSKPRGPNQDSLEKGSNALLGDLAPRRVGP